MFWPWSQKIVLSEPWCTVICLNNNLFLTKDTSPWDNIICIYNVKFTADLNSTEVSSKSHPWRDRPNESEQCDGRHFTTDEFQFEICRVNHAWYGLWRTMYERTNDVCAAVRGLPFMMSALKGGSRKIRQSEGSQEGRLRENADKGETGFKSPNILRTS